MTCRKNNQYPTEAEAREAMRLVPAKPSGLVPFSVYWCGEHHGWEYSASSQVKRFIQNRSRRNGGKRK